MLNRVYNYKRNAGYDVNGIVIIHTDGSVSGVVYLCSGEPFKGGDLH